MRLNWQINLGFPGVSMVKNLPAKAGDTSSIPGSGRSLGKGNGNPLQYSCWDKPMDRGAWQATVHGVTESQTRLSIRACPSNHQWEKGTRQDISWIYISSRDTQTPKPGLHQSHPSRFILRGHPWTPLFRFPGPLLPIDSSKKCLFLRLPELGSTVFIQTFHRRALSWTPGAIEQLPTSYISYTW